MVTVAGRQAAIVRAVLPDSVKEALIKEPPENAQVFPLARRALFLQQGWTFPSPTVSKKVKQHRQAKYIRVCLIVSGDGVQPLILIFGCGGKFLGVKAQKFHNLGFYLVAQVDVFVQQGAHFFTALAQLFRAKGKP